MNSSLGFLRTFEMHNMSSYFVERGIKEVLCITIHFFHLTQLAALFRVDMRLKPSCYWKENFPMNAGKPLYNRPLSKIHKFFTSVTSLNPTSVPRSSFLKLYLTLYRLCIKYYSFFPKIVLYQHWGAIGCTKMVNQ